MTMTELRKDLSDLGFGESLNEAVLLYLAVTSRKMSRKISVIISGESGCGKSVLINGITGLICKKDVMAVSFLTKAALLRTKNVRERVILLTEHIEDNSLASAFRQLVSEGRVYYHLVLQGKPEVLELRGPAVILESVVDADIIDFQNRNRAFCITLEPSLGDLNHRFKRIKKRRTIAWRELASGHISTARRHRRFQEGLQPFDVIIPFADRIAFSSPHSHAQRLLENFLNLVSAVAFLDQENRNKKELSNGQKYIEASLDDYEEAYDLITNVSMDTETGAVPKSSANLFKALTNSVYFTENTQFTRKMISEQLPEWTYKRIRRWIGPLVNVGLLGCGNARHGAKEYSFVSAENAEDLDLSENNGGGGDLSELLKDGLDSLIEPQELKSPDSLPKPAQDEGQAQTGDITDDTAETDQDAQVSDKEGECHED